MSSPSFRKYFLVALLAFAGLVKGITKIDSLKLLFQRVEAKEKCVVLNDLCIEYLYLNADSAMRYAKLGLELTKKINFKLQEGHILNNIGSIFLNENEFLKALDNYIASEKIFESIANNEGKALAIMNMGYVYELQNLFEKAETQYSIALKIAQEINNKDYEAQLLNHLGSLFYSTNKKKESLENFSKSLKINQEINNIPRVMEGLNNVAILYQELGNYKEALENFKTFLDYSRKISDKKSLVISYHNIALVYKDQKDYTNAVSYLDSSIFIAKEIKDFDDLREAYSTLSEIYKEQNNFVKALECFQLSALAKDSLLNQTRDKQFIEMSTKYETEKKEAENKLLKTEGEKQRTINLAITIGLVLVVALAFFIFRGYREKKKANVQLAAQNIEISEKKNIIEEKQKEILDSITYAKRLQEAILPPLNLIQQHLPESFIYYQPKDIVAGDFYWFEYLNSGTPRILLAAADCTGHGVPGAMVSVVCSNALNRAVLEFKISDPGKILDKTRELVLETFAKSDKDVKDGMDISLVSMQKNKDGITLQWAGANNPLWYTDKGQIVELTANKQPIGKTEKSSPFVTHIVELKKGESFFLFTDGYADQFGGPKGKKFKYKKLKELLLKNASQSSSEQKNETENTFVNWKGALEQVDDVCIIGVRI